jgi:hypothetical protein
VCIVKPGWAWPSRSETTLMGTPAATRSEAWVCRRSWNRIRGSPDVAVVRVNSCENDSGDGGSAASVEEHRRRRTDGCAFRDETVPPALQDADGVGVEVDAAAAGAGLHRALDGSAHRGLPSPDDRHTGSGGMEVAPVESGEFTATHPGVGDEMQRRVQPQTARSLKELGELLGVPDSGDR